MLRRATLATQRTLATAIRAPATRRTGAVQARAAFSTIYDDMIPYSETNRHRSDAEERIAKVPIVEVAGDVATCDGGGGALGHPLEFIQLDTVEHNKPQTCKYCGLRFKRQEGHHGGH